MKFKKKNLFISAFFLVLFIIISIKNIMIHDYSFFFFYCDFVPLLFAAGFLLEDHQFVKGILNIGLVPQFIFVVSFTLFVFFGINWNKSFSQPSFFIIFVSFLTHLVSANVAFFFTYKVKPKPKSLLYSAIFIVFLFVLTLEATPPLKNVNYVHSSSIFGINIPYYTHIWIILVFVVLALPTYFIQKAVYNHTNKSKIRL